MRRDRGSQRPPMTDEQRRRRPPVVHPVFLTHPISAKKVLYCNPGFTVRINELPEPDSDAMLDYLFAQQPRADDSVRRFREAVEQARLAREAGFDALAAGHHYLSPPYQSLQSLPLLARLAGEAPGMELCLSVLLLALLNPVQTAEEVASLDVMSEGRVVFGVGLGYREVEYEAFGVALKDRVPRMLEALDLIKRLWTEEAVTFEGRFFRVHDATCTIRPVQKPHPPIWIAANADPAVVRTARLGYPWFVNPHAALPTIERQWERYTQALAEANHPMP